MLPGKKIVEMDTVPELGYANLVLLYSRYQTSALKLDHAQLGTTGGSQLEITWLMVVLYLILDNGFHCISTTAEHMK